MAGRYWYFSEKKSPNITEAVRYFERDCGNSPSVMLHRLRIKTAPENLPPSAAQRLLKLQQAAQKKGYGYPVYHEDGTWKRETGSDWEDNMVPIGCGIVVLVILALAIYGLYNLIA